MPVFLECSDIPVSWLFLLVIFTYQKTFRFSLYHLSGELA